MLCQVHRIRVRQTPSLVLRSTLATCVQDEILPIDLCRQRSPAGRHWRTDRMSVYPIPLRSFRRSESLVRIARFSQFVQVSHITRFGVRYGELHRDWLPNT